MPLLIHQFPCLADNYGFLVHDPASGETVAIDTPDAEEYLRQAEAQGWAITQIWNTHWHRDHAGGNLAIKAATGARITAPAGDAAKIEGVDRVVDQGDSVAIGACTGHVLNVGGHTLGHVAYHLPGAAVDGGDIAFVGDALFALGCGRMFEGEAAQFWASLQRLKALPGATWLYCAHEYTASNARFARHADPDNAALATYAAEVDGKRADGLPTVPFPLARELVTNPFLRADDPALQAHWGGGDAVATFAALREAKNGF
ncbi:MAG TPA: hydroxyacylglutathione hydrolase [Novosphingobium sp.]|nr:hydroxyacylglutathione hydrolase [Novosphingobium sp.]